MEHADIISGAYTYTKEAFFALKQLPRWIVLFLYVALPILVCLAISSLILQMAVLPVLVNVFVNDNYGFTAASLSGLLQYFAVILSLCCVFFVPLIQGYCYRIAKSDSSEMPDHTNLWGLFFSGWRINFVILYYAIPIIVISLIYAMIFYYLFPEAGFYTTIDVLALESLFTVLITLSYVAVEFITIILVSLFAFVGLVHLTRSGSLAEATHIRGIADIIKKIGWYDYILSLVIMSILFLLVTFILILLAQIFAYNGVAIVILIGVYLFVMIPIMVFFIRYLSEVYDTAFRVPEEDDVDFDDF
ncbi:hypothetical protein Mlab_0912 [Methanocorpusculum labreanum Z]|uniref:Glycerophosphoryl diester phosphodiesterase membrane domain-containing protein n=1 Tax=Methanocorpusculum labreanum (strain ATCC 43576 / DSM 4855 / Z) TaxID=410358 RepID=A2SRX7_METLZ|nr:DUF4013 domain-containing protein [Methanocorpusculum labreanum]ABN07083.1 hypothetical protein Mlab_0912 [Methanocorpusculum labreanum Z]